MIKIENLNFAYQSGKGVFDIDFEVRKGQVVGFLGPNGAGKTTTIRCLLGFLRGGTGRCTISDLDCFEAAPRVALEIGYVAGEPAFPESMTGREFLDFLVDTRIAESEGKLKKAELKSRVESLVEYYELDTRPRIRRMSKGMKQKVAIIAAFMHDPEVLILDEPSSGLDPLMQAKFIEMLQNEKRRGKTILISSHMFEEIERTADRVIIIKGGRIVAQEQVKTLKRAQRRVYHIGGQGIGGKKIKWPKDFEVRTLDDNTAEVLIPSDQVDQFVKAIATLKIDELFKKDVKLEDIFMSYYTRAELISSQNVNSPPHSGPGVGATPVEVVQ